MRMTNTWISCLIFSGVFGRTQLVAFPPKEPVTGPFRGTSVRVFLPTSVKTGVISMTRLTGKAATVSPAQQ